MTGEAQRLRFDDHSKEESSLQGENLRVAICRVYDRYNTAKCSQRIKHCRSVSNSLDK